MDTIVGKSLDFSLILTSVNQTTITTFDVFTIMITLNVWTQCSEDDPLIFPGWWLNKVKFPHICIIYFSPRGRHHQTEFHFSADKKGRFLHRKVYFEKAKTSLLAIACFVEISFFLDDDNNQCTNSNHSIMYFSPRDRYHQPEFHFSAYK